ncbi:MAG: hypothetical protein IPO17_14675 [Flavobacteriales bacterium]|nr:hypothetical protein [Flavobacteriales bacterium]
MAQPFAGTIFVDQDIISTTDPSAFVSSTYTGQGVETMYDYRVPGWVNVNAYHFTVLWDDGLSTVAMVNPEFASEAAAGAEAVISVRHWAILPACARASTHCGSMRASLRSVGQQRDRDPHRSWTGVHR